MDAIETLQGFVGRQLVRIRRVFFTHCGKVDEDTGPLELTFEPDSAVVLDVGADGESLSITTESWKDPFGGPLSAEDEAWVADHGKWSVFDEFKEGEYKGLLRTALTSVTPLRVASGNVCGARLTFDSRSIDFVGIGDEALVFLDHHNDLRLAELKVFVAEGGGRGR